MSSVKRLLRLLWLRLRQSALWIRLLWYRRPLSLQYFESMQQGVINGVPARFCWDARYFYRAILNGVDVTFNKTPLIISENYSGKVTLTVFGLFDKTSCDLSLEVTDHKKLKQINVHELRYSQRITNLYRKVSEEIIPGACQPLKTKNTRINIMQTKFRFNLVKPDHIISETFVAKLTMNSRYTRFQEEFLIEKRINNGT